MLAVNCWLWLCASDADVGAIASVSAINVSVADDDFVGSATLVAVKVTVFPVGIVDGAVYKPPVTEPEEEPDGLKVQVRLWLLVPVTVGVKPCDWLI